MLVNVRAAAHRVIWHANTLKIMLRSVDSGKHHVHVTLGRLSLGGVTGSAASPAGVQATGQDDRGRLPALTGANGKAPTER
jgi:hypothetical protein